MSSHLASLFDTEQEILKRINAAIPKAYPIGARLEFSRMEAGIRVRDRGRVTGYIHRWRVDLIIRTDAGVTVTKTISRLSLKDIRVL